MVRSNALDVSCPRCHGTGLSAYELWCRDCRGTGRVKAEQRTAIRKAVQREAEVIAAMRRDMFPKLS